MPKKTSKQQEATFITKLSYLENYVGDIMEFAEKVVISLADLSQKIDDLREELQNGTEEKSKK